MILIVEDNPSNADLFAEALRSAGYENEVVKTGADAVERMVAHPYDLVLMDLSLPDMNGVEAACLARDRGSISRTVAVTGALALIDRAKLDEAGFVATLAKPCRLSTLVALAAEHVEKGP